VVDWLRAVARATRSSPQQLAPERARLRDWLEAMSWPGLDEALDSVRDVPAVFTHGDLSDGNIIVDDRGFTVIDWELASPHGWPLWDLLWLCVNAVPLLGGAGSEDDHVRHLTSLFVGDHPCSASFFGWVRSAARDLRLAPETVSPLVSLCLTSVGEHRRRLHLALGRSLPGWRPVERFAEEWFRHPALGPNWAAWRR
jgi:hypothetical protein